MARTWGDGSPTETLHRLSFDMYPALAQTLGCTSYRKLPVLSVSPGTSSRGVTKAKKDEVVGPMMPNWLDGNTGMIRPMGLGDDTAQITPIEFVEKMLEDRSGSGDSEQTVEVILGECLGVEVEGGKVTGVSYRRRGSGDEEVDVLPADAVVVSAGPWSCAAEDWFGTCELPMEGVKSTSIVWKKPDEGEVDATALFCGEDDRFGTHLEVYPRPDNSVYICGIGGSDYISKEDLKAGAFREECNAKETRVQAASDAFTTMSSMYKKNGELEKVQACMRPCPPDAMPYMGSIPDIEGAYINAGHNCWGIAWAPGAGKAMAELVLEGSCKCMDLSPFDPARFTPASKRGGRGRKRNGESVGEQW